MPDNLKYCTIRGGHYVRGAVYSSTASQSGRYERPELVIASTTDDLFENFQGRFQLRSDDSIFNVTDKICHGLSESMRGAYRTHSFLLFLCGTKIQILYWTHSMVLVSQSFFLLTEGDIFACFLGMFSKSSREIRGWDTSNIQLLNRTLHVNTTGAGLRSIFESYHLPLSSRIRR
jgi:hypothetical protein